MWRKATKIIILSLTAIFIIYDIVVVCNSEYDTISNVTMSAIWRFPFVAYAWLVLAGHFMSLIKTKRRYITALVLLSVGVLVYSILSAVGIAPVNAGIILIFAVSGFLVGTFTWSQRPIDKK